MPPDLTHGISRANGDYLIEVTGKNLALFVAIEADVDGRFSDNAFALLPDQKTTVRFTPTDPHATPEFTLRDLHSATYA